MAINILDDHSDLPLEYSDNEDMRIQWVNLIQSPLERRRKYSFARSRGLSREAAYRVRDWHWRWLYLYVWEVTETSRLSSASGNPRAA